EDNGAWQVVAMWIVFDPVVQRDGMQRVEQLPLVLVDALDLAVKERVRVEGDRLASVLVLALNDLHEAQLVVALGGTPLVGERRIGGKWRQALELEQVSHPALTDGRGDEIGQRWIGLLQPAALRDAVGLVAELLRPHLVEVPED